MDAVRVDSKGRIIIPKELRESWGLTEGKRLLLIGKEDYAILCKPARLKDFDDASNRLADEIAQRRRRPIPIQKLF
jgi:AbrB family looped-hinge helix DNA binding protein